MVTESHALDSRGTAGRDALQPVVEMRGIHKSFGPVQALRDAGITVASGEVHALLGENGAGKTTLMYILAGLYAADSGEIWIRGEESAIRSPRDAIQLGVGIVHQHFELVGPLTALENIILGTRGSLLGVDIKSHRNRVRALAEEHGFSIDVDVPANRLDVGDQQKVEVLRVLYAGSDIVILDEPTTHLTPAEVDRLFDILRSMARAGAITVILIAHKVREITAVSDRLTVLRRGEVVGEMGAADFDDREIVRLIVGGTGSDEGTVERERGQLGQALLTVADVGTHARPPAVSLKDVSLACRAGEIVGIAGVAGNGQPELMETLVGLRSIDSGTISFDHQEISNLPVWERAKRGLTWLPADRLRDGILRQAPIFESLTLGPHTVWRESERWKRSRLRQRAKELMSEFRVVAPHERAPSAVLSGGNIQKCLVGRALSLMEFSDRAVLLAMNPTSGLDVAATEFVRRSLNALASSGRGILLMSEDLDELLSLCDTIYVLSSGRIAGRFQWPEFDRYEIAARMLGGRSEDEG